MRRRDVRILDDAEALTRAAAEEFGRRVRERVEQAGFVTVALSGGSTPRGLYALLAEPREPAASLPWERIHLFWGDERDVPPDDPLSNFRMVRETLLSKVQVPADHVHRIRAEVGDAARAAWEYEQELRRFFGVAPGQVPPFDLVLLGMGADGHTASLFPGSDALRERERLVVAPWIEKLQARRITLTPPVLNGAACVLFLVHGADKAEALRAVLEGETFSGDDALPARSVRPAHGELIWLVDRAAARFLAA